MLFTPYKLNDSITLANRLVMAPLTRCFADNDLVPTQEMAAYYAKRAGAGLIISEATIIRPDGQGYPNTPGIYSAEQIEGWKKITQAVHKEGGKIFSQIWHTGRAAHSHFSGQTPVAPSAVTLEGSVPRMRDLAYEEPHALSVDEITTLIEDFAQAARNAIEAGFDGIEIHGANGYLIDQFLHQETNQRTDQYGGNPENRSRFALEVVNACIDAIGADKVAIRLSPAAYFNLNQVEGDADTFVYLLKQLSNLKLTYVHVGMFDDTQPIDYLDGRVSDFIRRHYEGSLIGCGGYDKESASTDINNNVVDLTAFGRPFIANPDLVSKLQSGGLLNEYSEEQLTQLI